MGSKNGMKRFLEQAETYYYNGGKCWRWDTEACKKQWQYGPWGEDLFMQKTMDDAEVQKKEDFTLTDTGTPWHEAKSGQEERIICAILYGLRCKQIHCCPPNEEPGCLEILLRRNFQLRHACIMLFLRAPWSALLGTMEFVFFCTR